VLKRPQEVDALEEAEKERRVPERGERSAEIGDEEDEEDEDGFALMMGRIKTIEAPVVPRKLADKVPKARIAVLVAGVATR
jgi:hypothetical protein